jgi:Protein of unknown function (DUF3667)
MEHSTRRHDKTCLNCGAEVQENFCSHCGQENTEPKESFRHLLNHFFADVTHYDSQFFTTLKFLVFRPGFLTVQYNAGRRLSYLNPIRMYIFISAIFFLVLFSAKTEENNNKPVVNAHSVNLYKQHLADSLRELEKAGSKPLLQETIRNGIYRQLAAKLDTVKNPVKKDESLGAAFDSNGNVVFTMQEGKYNSLTDYNVAQRKLPDTARDGAISQYIARKMIRLNEERGNTGKLIVKQNVAHNIPKIMFILLPLFALFVQMLYGLYNRRKYLYSQHAIFTLHFHSFVFLAFLVLDLLSMTSMSFNTWLIFDGILSVAIFVYLVAALHTAYQQKIWLSFVKALILSVCYMISLVLVMCAVFVVTFIAL